MANIGDVNIDFDNPLEEGFDDISLDIYDMQDPKAAVMLKNQAMDEFTRLNVFKGVTEFQGVVISNVKNLESDKGFLDTIADSIGGVDNRIAFKIHIPVLHKHLGNPCNVQDLEKYGSASGTKEIIIKKIIADHPWFVTKTWSSAWSGTQPSPGDWIKVKFAKGPSGGRVIEGQIVQVLGTKVNGAVVCDDDIISLFPQGDGAVGTLGATSSPNGPTDQDFDIGLATGIADETSIIFSYPFPQETSYSITSNFMPFRKIASLNLIGPHWGTDFGMQEGTKWLASADGKVVVSNVGSGQLVIEHKDPASGDLFYTTYHHCWEIMVKQGEEVFRGQVVATCGGGPNSKRPEENSTGAHLHFEMRRDAPYAKFEANSDKTDATEAFKTAFYNIGFDPLDVLTLPGIEYSTKEESKASENPRTSTEESDPLVADDLNLEEDIGEEENYAEEVEE